LDSRQLSDFLPIKLVSLLWKACIGHTWKLFLSSLRSSCVGIFVNLFLRQTLTASPERNFCLLLLGEA
ncbi:polyketide synthase, partial [Moniliophthora roreri]